MTSISLSDPWDGHALGYDEWKTGLPASWYEDDEDVDEPDCWGCNDHGFIAMDCEPDGATQRHPDPDNGNPPLVVVPCPCCSSEPTLWDLEQDDNEQQAPGRRQALRRYMLNSIDIPGVVWC